MKRILALIFALCILLCACGKQPETPTTEATEPSTEATEATTEATEADVLRHPLNGTPLEAPYTGRPTAIVLSNDPDALPQHAISQADFIFEAATEGGITRLLAVFSDVASVEGKIGPIRSARSFFNSISHSLNAPIVHCGGSNWGINGYIDDTTKLQDWAHINEQQNSAYFYRDPERSNYLSWLNLFTNAEKLAKGLDKLGYVPEAQKPVDYGFRFDEEVTLKGEAATKVTMNFSGSHTTKFQYDEETKQYSASQYGKDHIDGNTGKAMTYSNVISLNTKQWGVYDGHYTRSFYTLVGEGAGHFATGGKIVPIKWSRATAEDPLVFTFEDGTPITLRVGSTYVGIASDTVSMSYE